MIPLSVPEINGNEWTYIKECLDTNWVSSAGKYVDLFEERFKSYVGAEKAVVTVNGTAALHLALSILGVGYGDEVIVPSMSFIASVNPIVYNGAKPVFVDVCRDTFVMDVDKVEELITERTKVILPVHLYGNIVDMEPLMELANRKGIHVVEDATEALGSEYRYSDGKWHKAGTMGHIGCFSFNGNKLITTGAGGMLVTNSLETGNRAKFLSTQAKVVLENKAFFHTDVGYNYRMPNLLAAMGVAQLERVSEYVEIKRRNAELYDEMLRQINGITLVPQKENCRNSYWLYSAVVEKEFGVSRDSLIKGMLEKGIETRPFFHPIHLMEPYTSCMRGNLDVTGEIFRKGINLPSSVGIRSEEIEYVCRTISEAPATL